MGKSELTIQTIVVGVDGSEGCARAQHWAAQLALALGSQLVAVHAIEMPVYAGIGFEGAVSLMSDEHWREDVRRTFEDDWCAPIKESGVGYRTVFEEGHPSSVILMVAAREHADLIVVGRRGLGGFREMVLGSVSHEVSLHSGGVPVVLVGQPRTSAKAKQSLRGSQA